MPQGLKHLEFSYGCFLNKLIIIGLFEFFYRHMAPSILSLSFKHDPIRSLAYKVNHFVMLHGYRSIETMYNI